MAGPASAVFKSICEEVLLPAGVKVGGYPDELFKELPEAKREALGCQICYLVAKDAVRCGNGHLFCSPCIYAWSLTSDDNADRCPVCRHRGCYRNDASAADELAIMSVTCPEAGCTWSGQLLALRSHDHGAAVAGADARNAGLPFVRSRTGDAVFPDFGNGPEGFRATAEMERLRRRQRLARIHGHVLDGQARLAFLMSLFEEDLERRRGNLAAIASMQRRFHDQQFDQLIQLERELGAITTRLIQLVESATGAADRMNRTLSGSSTSAVATVRSTEPVGLADATNSPSDITGMHAALLPTLASSTIASNAASASGSSMAAVASAAATTAAAAAAAATAASVLGLGSGVSGAERRTRLQSASPPTPADGTVTLERLLARRDALANRLRSNGTSSAALSAGDAAVSAAAAAAAAAAASVGQQRYPRIANAAEAILAAAAPQQLSTTGAVETSRPAAVLGVVRVSIGGTGERMAREEMGSASGSSGAALVADDSRPSGSSSSRVAASIAAAAGAEGRQPSPPRTPRLPTAVAASFSVSRRDVGNYNPHIITYPPNRLQIPNRMGSAGTSPLFTAVSGSASESAGAASAQETLQSLRSSLTSEEHEQRSPVTHQQPSSRVLVGATVSMPSSSSTTVRSSSLEQSVSSVLPSVPLVLVYGNGGASGGVSHPSQPQGGDRESSTVTAAAAAAGAAAAATQATGTTTHRELSPPLRLQRLPAAAVSAAAVSARGDNSHASNPQVIVYPPSRRAAALSGWKSPPPPATGAVSTAATMRSGVGRRSTTPDVESGRLGAQQSSPPQRPSLVGSGTTASSLPGSAAATVGHSHPPLPGGATKTSSTQPSGTGGASVVGRGIQPNSVARSYCYL